MRPGQHRRRPSPRAEPIAINKNRVENIGAVPASKPSLPEVRRCGILCIENAPNVESKMVATYAPKGPRNLLLKEMTMRPRPVRGPSRSSPAFAKTDHECSRDGRPSATAASHKQRDTGGKRRCVETTRTNPKPAMKLNQLPSSKLPVGKQVTKIAIAADQFPWISDALG
jgi:hypothetical protein